MTSEEFFTLFLEELQDLPQLHSYYKFHSDPKKLEFRKLYFIQRLDYILKAVQQQKNKAVHPLRIWDCGCGYGTTCLFLAMNGIASFGSTLEFYFPYLPKRIEYWKQYGPSHLFSYDYENIFDVHPTPASIDVIIVQDTLHHLEPIDDALKIFHKCLSPEGILLSIEENGDNWIQSLKLYKQRGNKRIITIYDERLKKEILLGNENIRGLQHWKKLFADNGLVLDEESVQHVRLYPPQLFKGRNAYQMAQVEDKVNSAFLKKRFFFGLNFVATKAL